MKGSSKKPSKKPKEYTAAASPADPALWAEYVSEIKHAQEASDLEWGIGLGSIGKIVISLGETLKKANLLPLVQSKLPPR